MESQNTQQLTDDIQNKLSQHLKNLQVDVALEDESTSGDISANSHTSIDQESIELNNAVDKQEFQNLADLVNSKKLKETCWLDDDGYKRCKP